MDTRYVKDRFVDIHRLVQLRQTGLAAEYRGQHPSVVQDVVKDLHQAGGGLSRPSVRGTGAQIVKAGTGAMKSTAKAAAISGLDSGGSSAVAEIHPTKLGKRFAQSYMKDSSNDSIAYLGWFWAGVDKTVKVVTKPGLVSVVMLAWEVNSAANDICNRVVRNRIKSMLASVDVPLSFAYDPAKKLTRAGEELLKVPVGEISEPSFSTPFKSLGWSLLAIPEMSKQKDPRAYASWAKANPKAAELSRVARSEAMLVALDSALTNEIEVLIGLYANTAAYGRWLLERAATPEDDEELGYPGYAGFHSRDRARLLESSGRKLVELSRKVEKRMVEEIPNSWAFVSWLYGIQRA